MENQFKLNALVYKQKGKKSEMIPYQDRMDAQSFADGINIVVLADGLGSKKKSHIGAEIAVKTTIETLYELFKNFDGQNLEAERVKNTLLSKIRTEIQRKAEEEHESDVKEYACTLLFAIMTKKHIAIGQLGDGYIGVKKKGQSEPQIAFPPKDEKTEYVNSTRTIFDSPKHLQLALGKKENIDYIFLSSDGTDKLKRPNFKGQYTPFITAEFFGRKPQKPIFAFMEKLLGDSKKAEIHPSEYPEGMTNTMADMLLNSVPDDDVTFAFVNPNEEGPTRRVKDLIEILEKRKKRSQDRGEDR